MPGKGSVGLFQPWSRGGGMTRVKRGSQVAGPPPMLGLEEHGGGWAQGREMAQVGGTKRENTWMVMGK